MLVLNMNLQKIIIYNPIVVVEHNEYWGHHCNNQGITESSIGPENIYLHQTK